MMSAIGRSHSPLFTTIAQLIKSKRYNNITLKDNTMAITLKELRKLDVHTRNKMYETAMKEIKLGKSKRAKAWISTFPN